MKIVVAKQKIYTYLCLNSINKSDVFKVGMRVVIIKAQQYRVDSLLTLLHKIHFIMITEEEAVP